MDLSKGEGFVRSDEAEVDNTPQQTPSPARRSPSHYPAKPPAGGWTEHRAMIALGSNIGDRVANIESALSKMRKKGLKILKTSPLYETKPMYYENQDPFLNGVCQISTNLKPLLLLDALQDIENSLGRERTIDNGPRIIDLDIALYNEEKISEERLRVPHPKLAEREFVLRPLDRISSLQLVPEEDQPDEARPPLGRPVNQMLKALKYKDVSMLPICILSPKLPLIRVSDPTRLTHIMAIMNITPDSFSDGGVHDVKDLETIRQTAMEFISAGATILDIGGQSTRPGAEALTAERELERVLAVVRAIREMPEAESIAISVDTFHAKVARETIAAGADIINDISAGLMDERMLPTVAELGKTIILMHTRGDPKTMTSLTEYPTGLVHEVTKELSERVRAAVEAGIPQWRIILDPGIGFAKTEAQNLELLQRFAELSNNHTKDLRTATMPWLVGPSRKGFIGKVTGVKDAGQRSWGTAAAVTASIAGGADIVRVHDVAEMAQVAKMADAIYRRSAGLKSRSLREHS